MDRRSFLKLSGMLGLGVASATMAPLTAEAIRFNKKMMKVSKTRLAMGTFVSMTLLHPSRDHAEEAMDRAFREIDRLERLLSRYDHSTPVFHLNEEGTLRDIPPEFAEVMRQSFYYHRATGGSFDVTVKPAVDLFKKTLGDRKTWPTELEIREVLNLIDARNIEFNGKAVFFKKDGMGVTFDGIAKGYIVDKAAEILSNQSIQNFLINAGGDIRTQGCKQGNQPWVVAIEDPQKRQKYPDIVHMRDGAIATSGNYEVYFDKEKVFHHLVNPKTGLSPGLSTSVSIMARTTMEADALATSVFVMEPAVGTDFINSLPNCESLVMARDGSLLKSKGWKTAAT